MISSETMERQQTSSLGGIERGEPLLPLELLELDLSLEGSAEEIFLRADRISEDMIVEMIEKDPKPQPQTGEPTVFKRRTPDMSDLKDTATLDDAYDLIRMLDADGYPRAFLDVGPLRIEFSRAARKADGIAADAKITLREKTKE